MKFGESKYGDIVIILGNIKNETAKNWRRPHFEVKFYIKESKIVHTFQDDEFSFDIPANEIIPFKVIAQ
jgi:hypothetical protein